MSEPEYVDIGWLVHVFKLAVGRANARQVTVRCVFHEENTASMTIWRVSERWHCHGCNRGGSLVEFLDILDPMRIRSTGILDDPDQLALPFPEGSAGRGSA